MALPVEFFGAWRRVGLIIDGVRRVDYCDVLWLQSPDWFADIRTHIQPGVGPAADDPHAAFSGELSFAGKTEFTPPKLHWIHTLDSRGDAPPDQNPVSWQDELLIESGTFEWQGRVVPFVEEWGYLGTDGLRAVGHEDYVRVEAARFAIEVSCVAGKFSAVKYQQWDGDWAEAARVDTNV
ncbi:MAG: hypothetical protein ABWY93_03515 [Mycobacterium sp.]